MPGPLGDIRFDEKNVPPDGRPCKSDDNTRSFYAFFNLFLELILLGTQQFGHYFPSDGEMGFLCFQHTPCMSAADACDLALEIADSRLPRVMADHVVKRFILILDLICLQPTDRKSTRLNSS